MTPRNAAIVTYRAVPDRVGFVADLAANWVKLSARAGIRAQGGDHPCQLPQQGRPHRQWRGL